MRGDRPKVGEILLEAGIIDEMQLDSALGEQTRWGRRLGMTLVKLGMVQEGQLVRALARQFDMPVASLAGKKIAPEVLALVPARVAIEHSVVPLFTKKDGPKTQLFLGMEDPSDLGVLDDLAFRTGMSIRPVMVGPTELGESIDRYYNAKVAPVPRHLPDPMRAADTLTETNLRSLRDEGAPTLSELLKPGPANANATTNTNSDTDAKANATPRRLAPPDAIDATPLLPATPDEDHEAEDRTEPDPAPLAVAPSPRSEPGRLPPAAPIAAPASAHPQPQPAATAVAPPARATTPEPSPSAAPPPAGVSSTDVARALEESERTRLVAKAIAHLLIEKGLLTYEELQARIEKMKPRSGTADPDARASFS